MTEPLHTRSDRALAARIAFYEERPWVRPNVERWIETGVDTDGDLGPIDVMATMIAKRRVETDLVAFYKGVEAAAKEVEAEMVSCDIYVAAATPTSPTEKPSTALAHHTSRRQGAARCLTRVRGLIGLSKISKETP